MIIWGLGGAMKGAAGGGAPEKMCVADCAGAMKAADGNGAPACRI